MSALLLTLGPVFIRAQETPPPQIPESEILSLEQELRQQGGQGSSSVSSRRAFKNIARGGQALLDAAPQATNRFAVLGIIFQSQKGLLALENSERNRTALFAACEKLAKAPDEHAELRLEADLLLSERDLSGRDATLEERATALAELVERYRGTPAEARSLLMAALIAPKLDAAALEDAIIYTLDENFSDDPEVIEFRRRHLRISRLDVTFKGEFDRIDNTTLSFPSDTMGHISLMVFWSKNKPGFEGYLEKIKEELAQFSGLVDVFSFNVDELSDGGQSILREQGLDWTVMQLPEGRGHQAYRTYAQGDPVSVLVNEYGFAVIRPEIVHGRMAALDPARVSGERYMAQLQSLFIGDFLVADPPPAAAIPQDRLQAIQDCFVMPPFRYRVTRPEALALYRQADKLCDEALKQHPNTHALWPLRNRRIIALLGMWNLAGEPKFLEEAVREAKTSLEETLPAGADVVPRFCLAKAALRQGVRDADAVVTGFLKETGGERAPAAALAGAAILALEARSRELHEAYRGLFLQAHGEDPGFYAFASFLNNRHHRYRLLKANYSNRERGTRAYIVNHASEPMTNRLPRIELKQLDGSPLSLPNDANDKLTLLLFVEPPADPTADFPVVLDARGRTTKHDRIRSVMSYAQDLSAQHISKSVDVVAAFLSDDTNHVDYLMKTNAWSCQAAIVPNGLENPMVRQLGILSADRVPNVFLLRRDGTVAWQASGLEYKTEFGYPFALLLGMKVHIEVCEVEFAYRVLEKGDCKEAARIFSGPFLPADPDRYGWRSPRFHGRALAHMGLKDWDAALEDIDTAIDAHKLSHYRGRGAKRAEDWRQAAADFTVKEPCDILSELWATRAIILDQLGQTEEAAAMRKQAAGPITPDYPSVYRLFHEKLKTLRRNEKQETMR